MRYGMELACFCVQVNVHVISLVYTSLESDLYDRAKCPPYLNVFQKI